VILQDAGTMSEAVLKVAAPLYLADKDVLNTGSTANQNKEVIENEKVISIINIGCIFVLLRSAINGLG
jgi:hypothetical protein